MISTLTSTLLMMMIYLRLKLYIRIIYSSVCQVHIISYVNYAKYGTYILTKCHLAKEEQ